MPLERLNNKDYSLAEPFFKNFKINRPILHAVLENISAGNVLTDNVKEPSFMLVTSPSSYVFLAGQLDEKALESIVSYLYTLQHVTLISPLEWKFRNFFEKAGFTAIERLQFRKRESFVSSTSWQNKLPAGYSVQTINQENFSRCSWRAFISSFYSETDLIFSNGVGFLISHQDKVIAEAYGLISSGKVEIGVVTDELYRRQNLGTIICSHLLDYCHKNKLEPYWSCHTDNLASSSLARRLGFEEEYKYFFLKWKAG